MFRPLLPPARIVDKAHYSPWLEGRLHAALRAQNVTSIAITGGRTDVCVLATTPGAIDLGYRVFVLADAICSGADATHDAALELLAEHLTIQLDLVTTEAFPDRTGRSGTWYDDIFLLRARTSGPKPSSP
jgi:nicotinamidase-related amidase